MNAVGTGPAADRWLARVCGPTEMGRLVRDFDWAATPLGDPSGWPAGLRAAVGVTMASRFPLLIVWGPDHIKIYNDGYREMLGREKHPGALGAPAREVWAEIWDEVGAMFDTVTATGQPTWAEDRLFLIERNGFAEECYFTFSYSPLFDDDGTVGGVLDVSVETTEQVVAQRRLRCLAELTSALVAAEHVTDVYRLASLVLGRWRDDVPRADLYLLADGALTLMSSTRRRLAASTDDDTVTAVIRGGVARVLGDRVDGLRPAERFICPVGGRFGSAEGALVLDLSPLRPFDEGYRSFLELLAQVIGTALDSAYRRSVEQGHYRRLSDALQSAMLQPAADFATVAARYLPADDSLPIGGDWYDIVDLGDDRRALVVGDCVGHDLDAATAMAQLRSAARAMLLEGRGPAAALVALDSFAATLDGAHCASAFCVVVDHRAATLTYSRAGHPPGLLVTPEGLLWLDGAGGPPLGLTFGPERGDHTVDVPDDSVLVLYTDGLIERPHESIDRGLERLGQAALELVGEGTVQDVADGLVARLVGADLRDDVVVVVVKEVRGGATPRG